MANGSQMRTAISEATERLAIEGTSGATTKDVILAGFGYLAEEFRGSIHIRLDGKRLFLSGGLVAGVIAAFVRQLGI